MDFPIFHLDFLGNRALIAIIAVIHAIINHSLAVGLVPVIVGMEIKGFKSDTLEKQQGWDSLAYKIMFTAFVITTTIGAMTGVGIWFSASLVNPASIGSLIRVFFGAWFVEWIVFVTEVVLILFYFLTWKKLQSNPLQKYKHILIGLGLTFFSWITMAIIVSILAFMMDTGSWNTHRSFLYGFLNPLYLPQLLFRTPLSLTMGGMIAMFLTVLYTKPQDPIRKPALRFLGKWVLVAGPATALGGLYYYYSIPGNLTGNLPVAMGSMEFQSWYKQIIFLIAFAVGLVIICANWAFFSPKNLPAALTGISILIVFGLMGHFERLREFIRKPYVIGNYMYSNGIRAEDYPLLKRDGILPYSNFVVTHKVTPENKLEAGRDVFILACSRCHTTNGGVNPLTGKFGNMFGENVTWQTAQLKGYIQNMHKARYFMPPFPGNEQELDALCEYIKSLQSNPIPVEGAQNGLGFVPE